MPRKSGKADVMVAERPAATVASKDQPATRDWGSFATNAYEALRQEIFSGTLGPGARVTETEIAQRYNISRTPVREALKRLQSQGYLEEVPGRGLLVSDPPLSEILDAYLVRERLEGLAARLAAERALDADLIYLRNTYQQLLANLGDHTIAAELSIAFSEIIFSAARSPRLATMIESARTSHVMAMRGSLRDPRRLKQSTSERGEILAAIENRDGPAAELAMQTHLRNAREFRMANALSRPPSVRLG